MDDTFPVARLSIEIQEECIEEGAIQVLSKIRPNWAVNNIQFKLLTDGITNKLVRCCLTENSDDVVLVRVYGQKTDLLIDRKAETRNIILLHNENLAPRLYATFENGLAYEYVPGVTLTSETVIDTKIYSLIATKMAQLHLVRPSNNNSDEPVLWNKLDQFYNLVPDGFSDADKQEKFKSMNYPKPRLLQEMRNLKDILTKLNSPIVFAHNDLLLGNVIYNSECNLVTFIDYEYAAMNYQAYDIGNHFSEFAGVDSVDYSYYPNKELQWDWLRIYLQTYHQTNNISDDMIQDLYIQVNQFALAAHLLWGIWALIQAEHSTINFDFIQYAGIRFDEYFARKEEFLKLKHLKY